MVEFIFNQGKTNCLTFDGLQMLKGKNLIFIVRKVFSSFNLVQNEYEVVHMSDDAELIGVCRRVGKNYTPTKVCSVYGFGWDAICLRYIFCVPLMVTLFDYAVCIQAFLHVQHPLFAW